MAAVTSRANVLYRAFLTGSIVAMVTNYVTIVTKSWAILRNNKVTGETGNETDKTHVK